MVIFLFFLFKYTFFGLILSKNSLTFYVEISYLDHIENVKFDDDGHFLRFFASFVQKLYLAFWYYLINLAAVYSQRLEANGFSYFS